MSPTSGGRPRSRDRRGPALAHWGVGLTAAVVAALLVPGLGFAAPDLARPSARPPGTVHPAASSGGDSWTYLSSVTRNGDNPNETILSPSDGSHMVELWSYATGAPVYAEPAIVAGTLYLPTWSGDLDALNATNGTTIYSHFLGKQPGCAGAGSVGMASSPTVLGGTLYVGGVDGRWLAIGAGNGTPLWNVTTGSPSLGFYNWASPLLVGGEEYVGLASSCDVPLVTAAVLAINTTTHVIDARFNTTLNGSTGASVWSSPSYDAANHLVFVTTGNPSTSPDSMVYSESVIALQAKTLKLVGSWQIPQGNQVSDGDFGATPTIVDSGRATLVVAINKDGYLYAWNRSNVAAGPVWQTKVGASQHDIASAAYDGNQLYVGIGSSMKFRGHSYKGALDAVAPATGRVLWTDPVASPVFTAPYVANGIVVFESGAHVYVVQASNGKVLKTFTTPSGRFVNAPVISHGILYAGSSDGDLYAFGL